MIEKKDYLKNFRMMNEKEQKDYLACVEKYNDEVMPKLLALADSWVQVPVKDFDEGLRLITAIRSAHSFVSVAYQYTARRAVDKLRGHLADVRQLSGLAKLPYRKAEDKKRYKAIVPDKGRPTEDGTLVRREYKVEEVDNRRPEHLHQYIDVLPPELQKKTKKFDEMYLALTEYKGRLEVLAEHPDADDDMRAEFAQKAVAQEQAIRALWAEVDAAYDLAMNGTQEQKAEAAARAEAHRMAQQLTKPAAHYTKEEIDTFDDPYLREELKQARITANTCYIRRKDIKITDKYRAEMELRIKEMMEWGVELTNRVRRRCKEADIVIPGFNAPRVLFNEEEEE